MNPSLPCGCERSVAGSISSGYVRPSAGWDLNGRVAARSQHASKALGGCRCLLLIPLYYSHQTLLEGVKGLRRRRAAGRRAAGTRLCAGHNLRRVLCSPKERYNWLSLIMNAELWLWVLGNGRLRGGGHRAAATSGARCRLGAGNGRFMQMKANVRAKHRGRRHRDLGMQEDAFPCRRWWSVTIAQLSEPSALFLTIGIIAVCHRADGYRLLWVTTSRRPH